MPSQLGSKIKRGLSQIRGRLHVSQEIKPNVDRERAFHNERFEAGDNREAQSKYYYALRRGAKKYSQIIADTSRDAIVLEYGCGDSNKADLLARGSREYVGIDISDAAIERAIKRNNVAHARFLVMDATAMEFASGTFQTVFGSGILHHLNTRDAAVEINRVLASGGQAIFWEPLGLNPMINFYRYLTPSARTPDEHPFLPQDFEILREIFKSVEVSYFGLFSLCAVPFRRFAFGAVFLRGLEAIDYAVLRIPFVRNLAWFSLIVLRK